MLLSPSIMLHQNADSLAGFEEPWQPMCGTFVFVMIIQGIALASGRCSLLAGISGTSNESVLVNWLCWFKSWSIFRCHNSFLPTGKKGGAPRWSTKSSRTFRALHQVVVRWWRYKPPHEGVVWKGELAQVPEGAF